MYTVAVEVLESKIEGKGVFSKEKIIKNKVVWIYRPDHDQNMSNEAYEKLSLQSKKQIEKIGYFSPWSNKWIFPPENDPAQYTNHSKKNNLSAVYDSSISSEPFFIANKDIEVGEELTNNYFEFDKLTQETKPDWAV